MLRSNRCLAKLKFFLTEIQHCSDEAMYSRVNELIILLVCSEISPEIFYTRIQTLTDSSLEEFHLDIVRSGLPLLQNELLLIVPQPPNGQCSPPLNHSSSQEYMPEANGDIDSTPKHELFDSISNQMALKRSSSTSVGLELGDTVLVSTASMHKMMRLCESLVPLMEELHDYATEVLASGANKEFSESESNDSAGHQGSEADSFGQDLTANDVSTPLKESPELCKNCNRPSSFTCVCQHVSYCSAFCQDRDRDVHQREFFCRPPYQTVLVQPLVVERDTHQPNIITAPNGDPTPMATNNVSPNNTTMQNSNTSIFFQAIEMPSAPTTPICSITQPRK